MKRIILAGLLSVCSAAVVAAQDPLGVTVCGPILHDSIDPDFESWNGWGRDNANTRFQPQASGRLSAADVPNLKLKSAFGFPGARAVSGQPVVLSGRVFVSTDNGFVYSIDTTLGCVRWSFKPDGAVRSSVVVDRLAPGKPYAVFFGDARANAYAVDAVTGALIWKTHVEDHATARITGGVRFHEGKVYVPVASSEEGSGGAATYPCCTFRGSVVALNAETGKQVWKTYVIPDEPKPTTKNASGTQLFAPSGGAVWNSPTIDTKRRALYVGTGNAYSAPAAPGTDALVAMDLDTGKILWSVQETPNDVWLSTCIQRPGPNCGPDHDLSTSPILKTLPNGNALVIAGQKSGNVWAHDPDKKGAVVWKTPLVDNTTEFGGKIVWGGAADEQNVYFGLGPGGIAAVQLRDGQKKWFTPLQPAPGAPAKPGQEGALTAIPGAVISGGWDGVLRVLSSDDGKVLWEYNTIRDFDTVNKVPAKGGSMGAQGPVVANGLLFVPSGYVGVRQGVPGNVLLVFGVE